jgi:hypothetical protein
MERIVHKKRRRDETFERVFRENIGRRKGKGICATERFVRKRKNIAR